MNRDRAILVTLTLLRLVAGLLFFQAGAKKLFGWYGGMPDGQHLQLMSQIGLAGVLEVVGGALIILGLLTRPTAFVVAGEMAVAYFQAHQPKGTWPVENHGEPAVLLCFIFLFFAACGAGSWSLDSLISNRERR